MILKASRTIAFSRVNGRCVSFRFQRIVSADVKPTDDEELLDEDQPFVSSGDQTTLNNSLLVSGEFLLGSIESTRNFSFGRRNAIGFVRRSITGLRSNDVVAEQRTGTRRNETSRRGILPFTGQERVLVRNHRSTAGSTSNHRSNSSQNLHTDHLSRYRRRNAVCQIGRTLLLVVPLDVSFSFHFSSPGFQNSSPNIINERTFNGPKRRKSIFIKEKGKIARSSIVREDIVR